MRLLEAWNAWEPSAPPYVLDADKEVFSSRTSQDAIVVLESWQEAYESPRFCEPGDTRLHLGLLPIPFVGDLKCATVYLLMLNPGLGPHDYYGEHKVCAYRKALVRNLKQQFTRGMHPFMFLDPQFSWHGGFQWWHGKLAKVIKELSLRSGDSFADARRYLADRLACIELMPYHSASFRNTGQWLQGLLSVRFAQDFVQDVVLPRVRSGEACAIVTRQVRAWDLKQENGVVCYSGSESRAAHLTPGSRGGHAILEHIARLDGNYREVVSQRIG